MEAFNNKHSVKQKYLDKINASKITTRVESSIRHIMGDFNTNMFVGDLCLPIWFEEVVQYIHLNCTNEYSTGFARQWVDAIKPGVDVDKTRVPLVLSVMRLNHLNAVENSALISVIESIKQAVSTLELLRTVQSYKLPSVPSVLQITTRNKIKKIARLSAKVSKDSLTVIKKTIPRNQLYYLDAAIESLTNDAISVKRTIQYTVCTGVAIDVDIMGNELIRLLKELKT